MSGAVSVVFWILGLWRKQPVQRAAIFVVAVLCMYYSGYRIWNSEHQLYTEKAQAYQHEVEIYDTEVTNHMPNLIGEVTAVMTGMETGPHAGTMFVIVMRIRNTGGVGSIADEWTVGITDTEGNFYRGGIVETPVLPISDNGSLVPKKIMSGDDEIFKKTLTTPIPPGGQAVGYLVVHIDDPDFMKFRSSKIGAHITFRDVNEKEIRIDGVIQGIGFAGLPGYLPGIQMETPGITQQK